MELIKTFIVMLAVMASCGCHAHERDRNDSLITVHKDVTTGRYIIQINNQTKGNCYFWVHPIPIGQIAPQALIKRYFWSAPEGYDFAFGHLITEPNIEFHDCPVILGYNFIKLLSAGESFRLIIPSNNETCTDYTERIVIIPEEELHKYFEEIPDFFLYKGDNILIFK